MTSIVLRWPRHIRERCRPETEDPRCQNGTCVHVNLFCCRTCGGAEGDMPTDCPGERMTYGQRKAIYDDDLNYTWPHGWVRPEDRQWKSAWGAASRRSE